MRIASLLAAAIALGTAAVSAEEAHPLWRYAGYGSLLDAFVEAKKTSRRVLVGLPGVGT
jgi:hypothetical protein